MAYSIRGLFGVSAIVAIFLAALFSRSDMAVLLATLLFVMLILLGTALAFVTTQSNTFWRAFAVVALGSVLLSPQIALFEILAMLINAQVRPSPTVFITSSAQYTLPTPYPSPSVSSVGPSPSQSWSPIPSPASLPPAPIQVFNYSSGNGIDQLAKLLVVGSALLLGLVGAVMIDVVVAKAKEKSPAT